MANTSNGLIYGLAEMKFAGKAIGWIDENGLSPAGNNPTFVEVKAAQVLTGSVASILSDPGSTAFTFNLIKLNAQLSSSVTADTASRFQVQKLLRMDSRTA